MLTKTNYAAFTPVGLTELQCAAEKRVGNLCTGTPPYMLSADTALPERLNSALSHEPQVHPLSQMKMSYSDKSPVSLAKLPLYFAFYQHSYGTQDSHSACTV